MLESQQSTHQQSNKNDLLQEMRTIMLEHLQTEKFKFFMTPFMISKFAIKHVNLK